MNKNGSERGTEATHAVGRATRNDVVTKEMEQLQRQASSAE